MWPWRWTGSPTVSSTGRWSCAPRRHACPTRALLQGRVGVG
jgi:hypothetical protein